MRKDRVICMLHLPPLDAGWSERRLMQEADQGLATLVAAGATMVMVENNYDLTFQCQLDPAKRFLFRRILRFLGRREHAGVSLGVSVRWRDVPATEELFEAGLVQWGRIVAPHRAIVTRAGLSLPMDIRWRERLTALVSRGFLPLVDIRAKHAAFQSGGALGEDVAAIGSTGVRDIVVTTPSGERVPSAAFCKRISTVNGLHPTVWIGCAARLHHLRCPTWGRYSFIVGSALKEAERSSEPWRIDGRRVTRIMKASNDVPRLDS